ncbi:hypothetical protein [Flavobacterium litorale]|uniref:Signal peptidase n=1 Tax=Flavobacterium litorale TaxID=2856519 RepID=A0ABX8VCC7_9FLAO|nr:hypothetical protein [Flavobacterium litorale]QYJ68291.1 hypothetical protein K1I41_12325 [Flavobacterium litorale]
MRKLFLNLYVFIFLIASDYVMLAQSPGDEDGSGPGGVEGDDPVAPINGKIILLAVAAVAFAYYYFAKKKEEKQLMSN